MSVSHSITGGLVHLSGNPIEIILTASAALTNHRTAVKVKCDDLLSPEQIDEREPIALISKHNIQGLVDEPLPIDFHFPVTGVASAHAALVLNVALEIGEVWDDTSGERQESFSAISDVIRVIDGKLLPHELAVLNESAKSFASEYIDGGKFLTNQPNNMSVAPSQFVKLWYLSRWTGAHAATLYTKVTTSNKVGHIPISQAITLYPETGLLELSLNPIFQGFTLGTGLTIEKFEVWLEDGADEISERRTFLVDNKHYESQIFAYYRNKFSAVDSIWFKGQHQEGIKTEVETAYISIPVGSGTKAASIKTVTSTTARSWEINTGILSRSEMLALRGFLESKERWIIDPDNSGVLIPVQLDGGDFMLYDSMSTIQNLDIKLIEAHV